MDPNSLPRPLDLLPPLLPGLWVTLQVFAGGVVVALFAALLAGLGRLSRDPIVRTFSSLYIEVFRGTSALVQLFWFYFALPILLDIHLGAIQVGILVLGLNIGAYGAEVVRSAIEAVPRGQFAAATALNLTPTQSMRHVILPQALPIVLPPMGNLLIELLKSTALIYTLGVYDLTREGRFLVDATLRTTEVYGLLLLIYFVLSLAITASVRFLERRLRASLGGGATA